jgi:hypothetical protein
MALLMVLSKSASVYSGGKFIGAAVHISATWRNEFNTTFSDSM